MFVERKWRYQPASAFYALHATVRALKLSGHRLVNLCGSAAMICHRLANRTKMANNMNSYTKTFSQPILFLMLRCKLDCAVAGGGVGRGFLVVVAIVVIVVVAAAVIIAVVVEAILLGTLWNIFSSVGVDSGGLTNPLLTFSAKNEMLSKI